MLSPARAGKIISMTEKIDTQKYFENRKNFLESEPKFREMCLNCRQPHFNCYCSHIESFDPGVKYVILTHPIEVRRRIATGRMSHLCLDQSELIVGHDYTRNSKVNSILADQNYHCVILYPGRASINISSWTPLEKASLVPSGKKLAIFVIDGTWNTARKMLHLSSNLKALPQICFTPTRLSTFRVRKQPAPECVSTIEAIHQCIELLGAPDREHDKLLRVFDRLVEQQLVFVERANSRHTRRSKRSA